MPADAIPGGQRTDDRGQIDDPELLRRYAEDRSEAAFAELVQRHLNLVYSVAVRQCGGDVHLAQDVTQRVFTDLARKAAALARRPVLSGWLYRAAQFAATDVVRAERRRRAREQEAQAMQELSTNPATDADWDKLRPVLDEAMGELNERDRDAVMLRFVEGRAFADIGATLRLSEDAARMRVDRALDKLRALLAKRDITSTSAALAAVLANQAAATAPAGLAASVTGAALSGASAAAEAGAVAALIAFMTATKTTVVLGVAAALAVTTAVYQSSQARTATVTLAAASRDHAAARDRVAELDARVRAAEQALAERKKAVAQLAAAAPAAAEAANRQKALQQFLSSNPQLASLRNEAERVWWRATQGPVFKGFGFTPEQIEQAIEYEVQAAHWKKAQRAAGLEPQEFDPNLARFRTLFGDAAAARYAQYEKNWAETHLVSDIASTLHYADEPFTAEQVKRLIEILADAKTVNEPGVDTADPGMKRLARYDWDRVLSAAEPILSPVQMDGLRAHAAILRMGRMGFTFDSPPRETGAAPKP